MPVDIPRQFMFHAHAIGLAFRIRDPIHPVLPAQAAVTLPSVGGSEKACVCRGKLGSLVTFSCAFAQTTGDYDDLEAAAGLTHERERGNRLSATTTVEAVVKDLAVCTRKHEIKAAAVSLKMISRHAWNRETEFDTSAALTGLTVDGHPVRIQYAPWVQHPDRTDHVPSTFETVKKAYQEDDAFSRDWFCNERESSRPRRLRVSSGAASGLVLCNMLKPIWSDGERPPDITIEGNRISIAEFGSIYLGEMLMSKAERRLSMMRFAMGSADGADGEVCRTGGNGHTYPP
jgi:hypothetical protein